MRFLFYSVMLFFIVVTQQTKYFSLLMWLRENPCKNNLI